MVVSSCRRVSSSVRERAQPLSSVKYSLETASPFGGEEGGDDVKSAWRLCPGPHTHYNGPDNESQAGNCKLIS